MPQIITQRRGFLKIACSIIGSVGIAKYAEPFFKIANTYSDWIEDKGDFLIVRIPDFKTFKSESLLKPTIFLLGQNSIIKNIDVEGFVNIHAPKGGACYESRFDTSKMSIERQRPVVELKVEQFSFSSCDFNGTSRTCISYVN